MVGSFAVLRKRALTGDAVAHAALPGVCVAFLILGERNLTFMLLGALASGVLGIVIIAALCRWTRVREDAAIGLATGARMAGKQPVVLMQNSGLGVCINALTSLALMYKTPMLILITWRGYEGKDAPEHIIMGDISPRLLETIGVPHREPSPESLLDDLEWATKTQAETSLPTALLLRPGVTR